MLPPVGSATCIPPNVASVPFNAIILSPIETVVESTCVVVPWTNKLPLIVTFEPAPEPLTVTAPSNKDWDVSNFVILSPCVLSVDAIEELNEFKSLAALALKDVYSALLAEIVVATELLNVPFELATEELNIVIW